MRQGAWEEIADECVFEKTIARRAGGGLLIGRGTLTKNPTHGRWHDVEMELMEEVTGEGGGGGEEEEEEEEELRRKIRRMRGREDENEDQEEKPRTSTEED